MNRKGGTAIYPVTLIPMLKHRLPMTFRPSNWFGDLAWLT